MRRAQKGQAEGFVKLLGQVHEEIKKYIENRNFQAARELLAQCQEGALALGELIEKTEGEKSPVIPLLEEYCEEVYRIYKKLSGFQKANALKSDKKLRSILIRIENSIRNEIKVRYEIVFFPYKASMWDSLESVWQAAEADPDCDAYVVPIPYYDRNPDGSLGTYHYEGNELPPYVPVTHYEAYRIGDRKPDIAYIHNPYDNANYVTSVDPRFYSFELKKNVGCLVYIPYYATAGDMAEGQMKCMAYYYADYIIIQAEKYRKFFDPDLPEGKLLPLGSPKFDSVIHRCENPPEPPAAWKEKMAGKKVYFYNTSIGGMLGNTGKFLKKMEYVFRCFEGREDACLLWRPHPLLESTFASMRAGYYPLYETLKEQYIEKETGIYDDTPDIADTIAHCDVYIGDAATSVTSLFGITGKPMFILNNNLSREPAGEDWKGEIVRPILQLDGHDEWCITQGNKLYYSPGNDYHYAYYCDLSEYAYGDYYSNVYEVNGKVYVCPANAQDILVIMDRKVVKRIPLKHEMERTGAFYGSCCVGGYLFLLPFHYPAIVRYDLQRDRVDYITGYNDVFTALVEDEWRIGGSCVWKEYLLLASPVDDRVVAIEMKSCKAQVLHTGLQDMGGCMGMAPESLAAFRTEGMPSRDSSQGKIFPQAAYDASDEIWLLPFSGRMIARWNPVTGDSRIYSNIPADFKCIDRRRGFERECEDRPFGSLIFYKESLIIAPCWGNMFLQLDRETGMIRKWEPPFPVCYEEKNEYFGYWSPGGFVWRTVPVDSEEFAGAEGMDAPEWIREFYAGSDRKLYRLNLETGEYHEVEMFFDVKELREHEPGFWEDSEWLQYSCKENALNPLGQFLDGKAAGSPFDRDRQIASYNKIAANNDGTCGEKIHQLIKKKCEVGGKCGG